MENKFKRFLSLLLAFVMVLGMFPVGYASAETYTDIKSGWKKLSCDTEHNSAGEGPFDLAWDNDYGTIWHSNYATGSVDKVENGKTYAGSIDLGAEYTINWFSFTPRRNGENGRITKASLYVGQPDETQEGGFAWTPLAEHQTFAADQVRKVIFFDEQPVRYVKFVVEETNNGFICVSEFDIGLSLRAYVSSTASDEIGTYDKSVISISDGDNKTFWATPVDGTISDKYLIVDLGEEKLINQVDYTGRYANTWDCTGNLLDYKIWVSNDMENWGDAVATGDVTNGVANITFAPVYARYVKLTATKSYHWQDANKNKAMCVGEFAVHEYICVDHVYDDVCDADCNICRAERIAPHDWTDATCTTPKTCSVCKVTEGEMLGHSWGEGVVTTDATCINKGVKTYTCSCGAEKTEPVEIDSNAHGVIVNVAENAASCFADGNIEYWYCEDCSQAWSDEARETPIELGSVGTSANHDNVKYVAASDATCYANGNIEYWFCETCGQAWADEACTQLTNLKNVVVPMGHGNIIAVEACAATCYENGNLAYWYCTACGQAWLDKDCTRNTNLKAVVLPAAHKLVQVEAKAPTCTEAGWNAYEHCSKCDYTTKVEIPAGHTYGELIPAVAEVHTQTELKAAVAAHYFCDACDTYFTENKVETALAELTGETPKHEYKFECDQLCTVCGAYRVADHKYDEPYCIVQPTCVEDGYKTYACIFCNMGNRDIDLPALGHTFARQNGDPDAEKCGDCGEPNPNYVAPVAQIGDQKFTSLQAAFDAVKDNETITLLADVTLDTYLNVTTGCIINFNLNGHNITRNGGTGIYVNNAETMLAISGKGTVSADQAVWVNAGYVGIMEGNFYGTGDTIYTTGTGRVDISGGTFSAAETSHTANRYSVLNQKDDARETSSIVVYAGTFVGFNPANNFSEGPGTNFVDDESCSFENNGNWKVVYSHKKVDVAEVPAKCGEPGTAAGTVCKACGMILSGCETIPAPGHKNDNPVQENYVAPTCSADGSYDLVIYCGVCKDEISRETRTVPSGGHNFSDNAEFCRNECGTKNPNYEPPVVEVSKDLNIGGNGDVVVPETVKNNLFNEIIETVQNNEAVKNHKPVENHDDVNELRIELNTVKYNTEPYDEGGKVLYVPAVLVFDVSPMMNGVKVSETKAPITFRLPVPNSVAQTFAKVFHNNVQMPGLFEVKVEGNYKYVEIESANFSEYRVEFTNEEPVYVAQIGEQKFTSFDAALTAASAMSGDVVVEIFDRVTLNTSLTGNYDSIKFVGKGSIEPAEIYLDVQGYITATGKKVAFNDLRLSKSEGGYIANAGFMNVAFGVYDVAEVTYKNCIFNNGAYASSGKVTFNGCTFYKSHGNYGLWAYGDVDVTVNGCIFAESRGIKMYDEGGIGTAALTVKNSNFAWVTDKPAIVLTYGESVTLENNTYNSDQGTFELDLDGAPNGTPVVSDVAPTCKNDNGACGVLVDGKIYTTVAQAAEVATSGSKVELLHNSTETVELPEGVELDKNNFEAAGVTVKQPGPKGDNFTGYIREDAVWGEVRGNAKVSFVIKVLDANGNVMGTTTLNNVGGIIDGDVTVTWSLKYDAASNTDEYWNMEWTTAPTVDNMPKKVELWVDGVKVSGGDVVLNGPDNLWPIVALAEKDGKLVGAYQSVTAAVAAGAKTITLVRDTNEQIALTPDVTLNTNGHKAEGVYTPVAMIGTQGYKTIAEAIAAAKDGDTVVILPGEYGAINISNKNITIAGTVGENDELLTTIKGGNPAITGHGFNGTIKDLKIVDAWKVMYAEPAGNVTVDNVYVTGATYGFHLVAYAEGLTWKIQNSYMNLAWANSFGVYGGDAEIVIKGNQFESTDPYYPDYGALAVNTFLPNVTVEENIFGENAKIYIDNSVTDTSEINISKNYHADGVDNAFVDDDEGVTLYINEYYASVDEAGKLANLVKRYVQIGENYYATLAEAVAAAKSGDEIVLLADATIASGETVELNGVKLTAKNGAKLNNNGELKFTGVNLTDITIEGAGTTRFYNTINFYGTNSITSDINGTPFELVVNKGATLLITRFVLGYNRNITVYGEIEDAHSFDPAGKTPSLKFNSTSGVSVGGTGTGNLTVKDAYVELDSSSWKTAQGTYEWSFENSYVSAVSFTNCNAPSSDSAAWNVTFDDSVLVAKNYIKNGVATTYNFNNGSVATTGSLRIDGVLNIDETSSVTTTGQQNNVVGAVDEHGGINGTVNVEGTLTIGSNAKTQLEVLGGELNIEGGKVLLGNNTLTLDTESTLTIEATEVGEYTAIEGAVANNGAIVVKGDDTLEAKVVDGKVVVSKKPVASVNGVGYGTLEDAFKAATEGCTIEILRDVTVDGKWDCRDYATGGSHSQFKESVTINGNGHTIKFTGTVSDGNWNTIFRFEENATVNNLTVDISEATGVQRVISAKKSLTVDDLTIIGSARYGIIFGEGATAADLAAAEIVVKNSTLTGTRRAISDNENGKDVKSVEITGNTLNANVYASASESIKFNSNTASGEVDLRSYAAETVLTVEANGNTLNEAKKNYIYAKEINAQAEFSAEKAPMKVSTKAELNAALAAAQEGDTIVLTADIDYGTDHLKIEKAITLDLGDKTLTTRARNYGLALYNGCTVTNGKLNHAGTVAAIKVWDAKEISDLEIDVTGTSSSGNTIDGIVIQENASGVDTIKNVVIHSTAGQGVDSGIKTYNCGNATEPVIGSMDQVTVNAKTTGLNISAPCGTATNCSFNGGVNGIELWIKGTYSASLTLENSAVAGGVFAHDEFASNVTNSGTLTLTTDEATTGVTAKDVTLTINHSAEEQFKGEVLESIIENAQAKVGGTYYATLDAVFADTTLSGEVTVVLLKDASIDKVVDTHAKTTYNFVTYVDGGVTMNWNYADNWNYIQKASIGENITLNVKYLCVWTALDVYGTINTDYFYLNGGKTNIHEDAVVNANTGDATTQVKNGTVLTVNGMLNTSTLNVWKSNAQLVVSGENAKVEADWIDIWDGTPSVEIENGATLKTDGIKVSRGGEINVSDATLDAGSIEVGHNGNSAGVLTESGNSTINGEIKMTATGSVVNSDGGLSVTTNIADHKVVFENGQYVVVPKDYVAEVNGEKFESLAEAIEAAKEGDTVTLLKPIVVAAGETLTLDKAITISYTTDVAGEAMFTNNGTMVVDGANLVFTYTGAADSAYAKGNYTIANNGTLNIKSGSVENKTAKMSHASYAITNGNGGTIVIDGGKVINENNYAIRMFGNGSLTVNGGEVSGTRAVWMQAPGSNAANAPTISLTVNGGKLVGTGESADYKLAVYSYSYGDSLKNVSITVNGGEVDGDIALSGGKNKTVAETVTITGGTVTNLYSYAADEVAEESINVSGGTFANEIAKVYCAEGYIPVDNGDGTYGIIENIIFKIGTVGYHSLAEAVAAAKPGATITLLKDAEGPGAVIDKNLNINFGGFTYSFTEGVGSTGTESNGFQILKGNTVILRNGTLKVADSAADKFYILIQNYADLTVKQMTLDGTNLDKWSKHEDQVKNGDSYVISNNCGTVSLNATIITNDEGSKAWAFDVCDQTANGYTLPVVTTSTITTINGNKISTADAQAKIEAAVKCGNTYYVTLNQAVEAAKDNSGAFQLMRDITGPGVVINKNFILDFGGHTYTLTEGVGSTGTESNGFQILEGNTVTLRNGTLKVADSAADKFYILIQNYADLTVNNMTLDGTNLDKWSKTDGDSYTLSNNSGKVTIGPDTKIIANNDGALAFAFDACDKTAWDYELPVVTVHKTAVIEGNIEAAAKIGNVYYATLNQAIEAAASGKTITLVNDIDLSKVDTVLLDNAYDTYFKVEGKSITIDMNGKTISGDYTATNNMLVGVFSTDNGGHLTLTGNGTVNVTATGKVYSLIANYEDGCSITIENGSYTLDKASDSLIYSGGDAGENDGVTVKGGNFYLGNVGTGSNASPWIFNVRGQNDRNVVVSGGTFNMNVAKQYYALEVSVEDAKGNLGVVVDNGDDTWTVTGQTAEVGIVTTSSFHATKYLVGYATMADAVADAIEGDTIKAVRKVTFEKVTVDKSITIDENGFAITGEFVISDAAVTITANEVLTVTTSVKNSLVVYADGMYQVVDAVAKTGDGKFFATLQDAVAYANANLTQTTISLLKNVEIDETLVINTSAIKVLGSNGKTIKSTADVAIRIANGTKSLYFRGTLDTTEAPSGSVAFQVETAATLKIDSSALINAGGNVAFKLIKNAKTVEITDAKVNAGQFIYSETKGAANVEMEGATVTINGTYTAAIEIYSGKLLVSMKNDAFKDKCTIKVTGEHAVYVAGENLANYNGVIDFDKQNGFFEKYQYMKVTVESGYEKYVTDVAQNVTTGVFYDSLDEAIETAKTGETVKLMRNIAIDSTKLVANSDGYATIYNVAGKAITLDLNGKKIEATVTTADMAGYVDGILIGVFCVDDNGALTVTGNGTVTATLVEGSEEMLPTDSKLYALMVAYGENSKLTVENGTYHANAVNSALFYAQYDENVIINGGTYTLGNLGTGANGSPWLFNAKGRNERNVVVNGGNFSADVFHQYWFFEVQSPETVALKYNDKTELWESTPAAAYVNEQGWSSKWYTKNVGYATVAEAVAAVGPVESRKVGKNEYWSKQENVYVIANTNEDVVLPESFAGALYLGNFTVGSVTSESKNLELGLAAGTYESLPTDRLEEGVTLNCEGATITGATNMNVNGATIVGATFSNENGTAGTSTVNGTFKNCVFDGYNGMRWCYAGDTVVFENCIFTGDVYGVHFDGGANEVIFINCTFSGFNAMGGAITKLTMKGCTFKSNGRSNYNGINLWGDTELIDCTFVFDGSVANEWVDMCGSNKTLTITGCVVTDGTNEQSLAAVVGDYGTDNTIIVDGTTLLTNN